MMNALQAMDEVMSANDINMNIAATTPAFVPMFLGGQVFKYLYYALLQLGTSREETYATFRNVLTDVERLLNMRDSPPSSMTRGHEGQPGQAHNGTVESAKPCVLGRDDLGMLMLLIHECRTILWSQRRRFGPTVIASVSEDLAELAGERGKYS
jgi:ATP synthase regulation protein NCA2